MNQLLYAWQFDDEDPWFFIERLLPMTSVFHPSSHVDACL